MLLCEYPKRKLTVDCGSSVRSTSLMRRVVANECVVVGVASPPHAIEVEIVEQQALVIDRLHRKRLVKDSRASLQIYQCVVHVAAAGHVGTPVAQFDGLVNLVAPGSRAIGFAGRGCGRSRIRAGSLGE